MRADIVITSYLMIVLDLPKVSLQIIDHCAKFVNQKDV